MFIELLKIYLIINIMTWCLAIGFWLYYYLMFLNDKYEESKVENKTESTIIEPTNPDNIHYSEYISGEDFMNIFPTVESAESYTYSNGYVKPIEKFYYNGHYLTKEEVIEKAHEILRRNINY